MFNRQKVEYCRRLDGAWQEVADLVGIKGHERDRFSPGDEAREIWHWLERRGRLAELPEALRGANRTDLADLLEGRPQSTAAAVGFVVARFDTHHSEPHLRDTYRAVLQGVDNPDVEVLDSLTVPAHIPNLHIVAHEVHGIVSGRVSDDAVRRALAARLADRSQSVEIIAVGPPARRAEALRRIEDWLGDHHPDEFSVSGVDDRDALSAKISTGIELLINQNLRARRLFGRPGGAFHREGPGDPNVGGYR